ncbi:AAA family ATPase [mine drainage metagenome]|uniref:AAA family ATPase n=1 Tax=mine drainage metagenome TaxID=410659 RepID=T1BN46_9ZZZZ
MSKEKGSLEPWYRVVTPRPEVRKGRSFNPDEFAIALEQVVRGNAPLDYLDPKQFFSRTVFTRALREHLGMVLRRLRGETEDTAPVLTLITQFGGGKTHTLTALYHLVKTPKIAEKDPGVRSVLLEGGKLDIPKTKVAVLVGNAWDPREGFETPWIDIARQLAGDAGVAALGPRAKTSPPGTETLSELFRLSGGRVLILCDEVLNLVNRHRDLADQLHSFIQNLTVALTGTRSRLLSSAFPEVRSR